MPNHSSYHGEVTGAEAEERLKENGGICFLTRYSTRQGKYVFSVIDSSANVHHIEITIDQDAPLFSLKNTEKQFKSMENLFRYYRSNPLTSSIRSIGKPCYQPELQVFYRRCHYFLCRIHFHFHTLLNFCILFFLFTQVILLDFIKICSPKIVYYAFVLHEMSKKNGMS